MVLPICSVQALHGSLCAHHACVPSDVDVKGDQCKMKRFAGDISGRKGLLTRHRRGAHHTSLPMWTRRSPSVSCVCSDISVSFAR